MKIAKLGGFLAIFGAVLAAALAGINLLTKDVIAKNNEKAAQEGLYQTLAKDVEKFCTVNTDGCVKFDASKTSKIITGDVKNVYAALNKSNKVIGFVYETVTTNGFGTITMLTGFNKSGLAGWTCLSPGQSPGYGKDLLENGKFKMYILEGKYQDVTSGVTITTSTVTNVVKTVTTNFNSNLKGEIK